LKACEINYKAHTSKHGTTTEQEFNLWLSELQDMSPIKIAQSFKLHLQNSAFFPTIADIRNAIAEHRRAKAADEWNTNVKALPAPDKKPMPMKARLTLLKLMDEARKDPNVQKAERRKESALKVKETYGGRHERKRTIKSNPRTPMSQEAMDRVFYGNNYGSSS
tara:strand:+ start:1445 stop:1936 length:492 start_codon:yes stop_codon:yes gene_type:complete